MAAKKETKEKSAPKFSFDDLSKEIKKVNPQSGMANEKLMSAVDGYIDSGNYMLNACISGSLFGGWPENRFSILAGESSTGKTYVCLSAVKRAIENGYNIVYFDSENAVDEKFFNNFGIDTSKVNYQPVQTVQEFRTIITTILEKLKEAKNKGLEIPKVLFVIDSIGNLATQKEIDDAISGSEKADMTRTKVLKSIFRIIMVPMAEVGATILGSNHTYQCVTGDTLVQLDDNILKPIKDIKIGDFVNTTFGRKKVIDTFEYDDVDTFEIKLSDGNVIKCTNKHKFAVKDKDSFKWVELKDLKTGDKILKIK